MWIFNGLFMIRSILGNFIGIILLGNVFVWVRWGKMKWFFTNCIIVDKGFYCFLLIG